MHHKIKPDMNILQRLKQKSKISIILSVIIFFILSLPESACYTAYADESISDNDTTENAEETGSVSESVAINMPSDTLGNTAAPKITAEGAILMDAGNGAILYQKNIDTPYFPASITKIMTCLLAVENCSLNETVTMSHEAVFGIDRGSSNVGLDVGQAISMEEAVLCVMLASANEAASAIAEHVSGSIDDFVDLMNQRAVELGCTNTHFENANGLPNDNHVISPRDMALIAKAFNENDTCRRLASMRTYDVAVTPTQPDEIHLLNHHKMYEGLPYAYDPVVWGKTGYTTVAGATLVTVAESNGLSLICVVMKDESEKNYADTRSLLDFGFGNYIKSNISENDDHYKMTEAEFFQSEDDTFGDTGSFISQDTGGYVILPEGTPFSSLDTSIRYTNDPESRIFATVSYEMDGQYAGECDLLLNDSNTDRAEINNMLTETVDSENVKVTYIDVTKLIPYVVAFLVLFAIIAVLIHLMKVYNVGNAMSRRREIKKRQKRYHSDFDDIDF